MRLIKKQSTNERFLGGGPRSRIGIDVEPNGQVNVISDNNMLIPVGPTSTRPLTPQNGMMRYNTDIDSIEMYVDNAWRSTRFKEPRAIVQQNLGVGDANETVFGPLNNGDPDFPVPASAESVLVIVENVIQVSQTNYTLEQNPTGPNAPYDPGWFIKFTSPVPLGRAVTVLHNFDK